MKLSDGTVVSSSFRGRPLQLEHGVHAQPRSSFLKIGTVIAVRNIDSDDGLQSSATISSENKDGTPYETVYDVKVDDMMARPFIYNGCRVIRPFYGPNNYFEVTHEAAADSPTYSEKLIFLQQAESIAGARCVLLLLEGVSTAPVIVGFLTHPARKSKITKDKKTHMGFEFNGLKVDIDKDGAFTLEAAGPLLPAISLPTGPILEPNIRLDPINGPLKIEIDKSFNFKLTDIAGQMISITHSTPLTGVIEIGNGGDFVSIEKSLAGGVISINSSKDMNIASTMMSIGATAKLDISTAQLSVSADASTEIKTGTLKIDSTISSSLKALQFSIESTTTFSLQCATMKFEGKAGELLATLKQILEGIGNCTPASPVGPCAPISGAPQWTALVAPALKILSSLTGG